MGNSKNQEEMADNVADAGDGSKCLAPFGYEGPCGDSAEFGGLAPHQKEALARECGAAFAVGSGTASLAIKRAEDALSKTCGPKCLSVFRAHASASGLPEALGQAAAHAERSGAGRQLSGEGAGQDGR